MSLLTKETAQGKKKSGVWTTECPTKDYVAWKHKASGWENILMMAEEMQNDGYRHLWRRVCGVDLVTAEAHYHDRCYHSFYMDYDNFQRHKKMEEADPRDTEHSRKCIAHVNAYEIVLEIVKARVIEKK